MSMSHWSVENKTKREKTKKTSKFDKFVAHFVLLRGKATNSIADSIRLVSCSLKSVVRAVTKTRIKVYANCAGAAAVYTAAEWPSDTKKRNWKICQKRRHMLSTKNNNTQQIHVKCSSYGFFSVHGRANNRQQNRIERAFSERGSHCHFGEECFGLIHSSNPLDFSTQRKSVNQTQNSSDVVFFSFVLWFAVRVTLIISPLTNEHLPMQQK